MLSELCKEGSVERFLIFLLIEGGICNKRENFKKNIQFYLDCRAKEFENVKVKLDIDCCDNPIIMVFLPERELGIGRKRKIMMLISEYFQMQRFFLIDDDIDSFQEYNKNSQKRQHSDMAAFKALDYMSQVLSDGIDGKDVEKLADDNENKIKIDSKLKLSWVKELVKLEDSIKTEHEVEYDQLLQLVNDGNFYQDRDRILYPLKCICGENNSLYKDVYRNLYHERSKVIGQVALLNQSSYLVAKACDPRLEGSIKYTHSVLSSRYQLVLYNLNAIKGIHPVSDDAFFELPLNKEERIDNCKKAMKKGFSHEIACKVARLGYKYSDKAHVYYQIQNGVSGYVVYYFSFETMKVPSKVNGDETNSNMDSQNSIKNEEEKKLELD